MLRLIRVHGAQLVTITGPPGVGKTRFAAEVAVELEGRLDVVLLDDVDAVDERADLRLVTRTEPLRVAHERAYRLRPLAEAPAVELFRQRADAAAQRYGASYAELAALCRRLGRLPLAIILAAG